MNIVLLMSGLVLIFDSLVLSRGAATPSAWVAALAVVPPGIGIVIYALGADIPPSASVGVVIVQASMMVLALALHVGHRRSVARRAAIDQRVEAHRREARHARVRAYAVAERMDLRV